MRPSEASRRRAEPNPETIGRQVAVPYPAPAPPQENAAGGSLVEFSTIVGDNPNEGVEFGDTPQDCKCPHCERNVVTFLDFEASFVSYLLAFVVWISLGWMAFWVLPLLWPAFKDVVHHCPRCLNVIERKSRINLPTFRTEVMTCKVGGCAVVLARKYVAIMLGLVGLIVTAYFLRSTIQMNTVHEHKGTPSMLTWEDFVFDCGPRTSLSHRPSTALLFEERYRKKTFKWQGEVRIIREGFDVLFLRTKNVLMVQMYPPRFKGRHGDHPDVAVLFGVERNKEVANLSPGDWVEFEATMSAHGFRGDPEVMVLWHIEKLTRPDPPWSSAGAHEVGQLKAKTEAKAVVAEVAEKQQVAVEDKKAENAAKDKEAGETHVEAKEAGLAVEDKGAGGAGESRGHPTEEGKEQQPELRP